MQSAESTLPETASPETPPDATLAAVRAEAEEAERAWRRLVKTPTPEQEAALAALASGSVRDLMRRHAACRRWYREHTAAASAERARRPEVREQAQYLLIGRVPEEVPLAGGGTLPIYGKSMAVMDAWLHRWALVQRLTRRLAAAERRMRLTDLPLYWRALRARTRAIHEMVALAVHPDPTPPLDDPLAALTPAHRRLVARLTWEDLGNIERGFFQATTGRYLPLVVDPDAVRGKTDEEKAAHTGLGHFIAMIAKHRRVSEAEVQRLDYYQLLASLDATADRDEPEEGSEEEVLGLLGKM